VEKALFEAIKPIIGEIIGVVFILIVGYLVWYFKEVTKTKREFFLNRGSISDSDKAMMQDREARMYKDGKYVPTIEAEIAERRFRALPDDQQDKLENKYELYQEIKRLSEHGWLNNYRHLAACVLAFLSRIFSESNPFSVKESLDYQPHAAKTLTRTLSQWFTFESYLILLVVALMYPAVLASLNSVVTQSIAIAGVKVLAFDSLGQVLVFLIALMASLFLVWQLVRGQWVKELTVRGQRGVASKFIKQAFAAYFSFPFWKRLGALLMLWLGVYFIAGAQALTWVLGLNFVFYYAGAGAVVFSVAGAFVGAVVVAVAGAFVGAVAVAGAFAFAVAVAGAGAFGGAFAVLFENNASDAEKPRLSSVKRIVSNSGVKIGLSLTISLSMLFVLFTNIIEKNEQDTTPLLFVLMGLLPLCNAVVDWLSLNITRHLTYKIIAETHSWLKNWFYVLVDAGLALVFVFLVTTTTVAGLSLISGWVGAPLLDFTQLMTSIQDKSHIWEHLWIHLMLFSTLIPTLFHLGLALYMSVIMVITHWQRDAFQRYLDAPHLKDPENRNELFFYANFRWFFVVIIVVGLGFLFYGLSQYIGGAACVLWRYADGLLQFFNMPGYQSPQLTCG